jgi:hypothetical protein
MFMPLPAFQVSAVEELDCLGFALARRDNRRLLLVIRRGQGGDADKEEGSANSGASHTGYSGLVVSVHLPKGRRVPVPDHTSGCRWNQASWRFMLALGGSATGIICQFDPYKLLTRPAYAAADSVLQVAPLIPSRGCCMVEASPCRVEKIGAGA